MGNDSEKAHGASSGFEKAWVGDGLVLAVGIDVFNLADKVGEGFMAEATTMADGDVGATKGNSKTRLASRDRDSEG
jgi:hypothetical protein